MMLAKQDFTALPALSFAAPPLLIAGSGGALGQAFRQVCQVRGLDAVGLGRAEFDSGLALYLADVQLPVAPPALCA